MTKLTLLGTYSETSATGSDDNSVVGVINDGVVANSGFALSKKQGSTLESLQLELVSDKPFLSL